MEDVDIELLAQEAQDLLHYHDREQITNRLHRMIIRNQAYLKRRQSRGTHTSHDDTTAEDMAVVALAIQIIRGRIDL